MTAEIAIMNKNGLALASDSAVTIRTISGDKIYDTANKLFMLSKFEPIAIMVYDGAKFMEVPWETVIKSYRKYSLAREKFNTVKEYAEHFLNYLEDDLIIVSEEIQVKVYRDKIIYLFQQINEDINNRINSIKNKKIIVKEIQKIISDIIDCWYNSWEKLKDLNSLKNIDIKEHIDKHRNMIIEIKEKVFEDLPIAEKDVNKLLYIAAYLFKKDNFISKSNIVIAGFGEKDIFPALCEYQVAFKVNNKLKYKLIRDDQISFDQSVQITPFAVTEMVYTFMEGIDEEQVNIIDRFLKRVFYEEYPNQIISEFECFKEDDLKDLRKIGKVIIDEFGKYMEKHRWVHNVNPVIRAVEFLPKDELANLAESLIKLTSIKKRVSMDKETVGGPIDVAVITKGDGFVWIKRKHYFDADYNHHFFNNYYLDREV